MHFADDFNVDLLKCDDDTNNGIFFDLLSSYGYRTLILQPTRVTSDSATIIDNIYINDIEARSSGGNITTSISDHVPQFCVLDIFFKTSKPKNVRYGRSYKNLYHDEFKNELKIFDWETHFVITIVMIILQPFSKPLSDFWMRWLLCDA